MIFAKALEETIKAGKTLTENGAVGYKTSKSSLVDFNFKASSFRNQSEQDIENAFADAYGENPLLAVKLMFMAGDIRQGMGERRTFKVCLKWLAKHHKEVAEKIICLVPEYSRWDVVVDVLGTEVDSVAFSIIKSQLEADYANYLNRQPISLLAKWLPSVNTSSQNARKKARSICARLKMTEKQYRKRLSSLRAKLNIVETKMSANKWSKIAYESVPSKANLIYKNAFMRHNETRRTEYLDSIEKGEAKINSSALFPYEIVARYDSAFSAHDRIDATLEAMWKALPDYANGKGENTLCVIDGSGSMISSIGGTNVTCRDVAISLGIYFSEKMPGQFHDKYITFSENPKPVDLGNCNTLNEKVHEALRHHECENKNIEKVFKLILDTAKNHGLKQDEMPKSILIISDMEFDGAVDLSTSGENDFWNGEPFDDSFKALFEKIGDEYHQAGYELPKLVFWNICSRTGAVPLQQNKNGVILVSGFNPTIASMVFSQKNDPYEALLEKLNSNRYEAVEKALA